MRRTRKPEGKVHAVRLAAPTSARLSRLAKKHGVSVAELIRRAVESFVAPTIWERLESNVGAKGSGLGDLSTNKRHLAGFGQRKPPSSRLARS